MLCNNLFPEVYLQGEIENLPSAWIYNLRTREHMPACSCIYFDPFNSLKLLEVPIYWDLARNSLSSQKNKVLKNHQESQEASWTSDIFTNIFDESSVNK